MANTWDDHYTRRARKEGYPARSVYKLGELQDRFRLIPRRAHVLDVGAAPGSWTLYLIRTLGCSVVAVDLQPLEIDSKWRSKLTEIRGDILADGVVERILAEGPYAAVVSDAAPATTGSRLADTAQSEELAQRVLELAGMCLEEGGSLVVKILQGGWEKTLLERVRTEFETARFAKPKASRSASTETYLLGLNRKKT